MTLQHVLIFYSHQQDKELWSELLQHFTVSAYLLDQEPEECMPAHPPSAIVVFDSSKEEKGIESLPSIVDAYPDKPLFLVVEDPSKAYLLAALKQRVHHFFTLPPKEGVLLNAVLKVVPSRPPTPWHRKVQTWLQGLWRRMRPAGNAREDPLPALHRQPPAPSSELFLPEKQLILDESYDMLVLFFGNFSVYSKHSAMPPMKGKKNITILAYLLFYHHKLIHKDVLMDQFWRDHTTSSAKNSLNVAIYSIRKNLSKIFKDEDVIIYDQESYGLNPELKIITDTEKFMHFWKKGSRIETTQGIEKALSTYNTALEIYKQEFLPSLRFDDWCEYERENLKEIYLFILNRLGNYFFERKQYEACINICKRMLDEDDCLEEVYRKLICCYSMTGLNDLAIRQYFKCKKTLHQELNMAPSEQTEQLYRSLQSGEQIRNC
jgi:DNA-binding SARP family transcriptional activator